MSPTTRGDQRLARLRLAVSAVGAEVVVAFYAEGSSDAEMQAAIAASPCRLSPEAARTLAGSLCDAADYIIGGKGGLQS